MREKVMIKVMIVDDVTILRNSLKYVIEKDCELCVVGTAANGQEALELCKCTKPDVILMDIKMPVCDGVEATLLIKMIYPDIKIIILTTFNDDRSIKIALQSGASGYVLKDIEGTELISAIKNTYKGLSIIHQEVLLSLTRQIEDKSIYTTNFTDTSKDDALALLSIREIEIIRMLAQGKIYKEIANTLFIADGTLRNIISEILRKLDLKDKTQLIIYAVRNKLI